MSDFSPELMDQAKRRDSRLAQVADAIDVDVELRDSPTIKAIISALNDDANQALEDLSNVSPLDHVSVAQHLVVIRSYVYIRRALDALVKRGRRIEDELRAEDRAGYAQSEAREYSDVD